MNVLEQAQQAADQVRGDLVATLKELDARKKHLLDWRYQLRSRPARVLLGALALSAAFGAVAMLAFMSGMMARASERRFRALPRAKRVFRLMSGL